MSATLDGSVENRIDSRPFFWAMALVAFLVIVWAGFEFIGNQRYHNTELWQRWHPITMKSAPQIAKPVENMNREGMQFAVVETERGLYFLTGMKYVPKAGEKVIVESNDQWDLYLCAADGQKCMTIHSFCANASWETITRDDEGRVKGCYAPYHGSGKSNEAVAAITLPPENRNGSPGGRRKMMPAMGMSPPSEWAWRMGLPTAKSGSHTAE